MKDVSSRQRAASHHTWRLNARQGNGALQAPPPAPIARWTRLVLVPAVIEDTTQPISRSTGVTMSLLSQDGAEHPQETTQFYFFNMKMYNTK